MLDPWIIEEIRREEERRRVRERPVLEIPGDGATPVAEDSGPSGPRPVPYYDDRDRERDRDDVPRGIAIVDFSV